MFRRNPLHTWVFVTKAWYSCGKCRYHVCVDVCLSTRPDAILYVLWYLLRRYGLPVKMLFPCAGWFLSVHISWRNPLYTWVFITKIWYSFRKCYYFVYTDVWISSCPDAFIDIHGYSLRKYDITVGSVELIPRVMCVVSWHSRRKCCVSCINCCLFRWCHMNPKKSQLTGHSTSCLTAYANPHQRKINVRITGPL